MSLLFQDKPRIRIALAAQRLYKGLLPLTIKAIKALSAMENENMTNKCVIEQTVQGGICVEKAPKS